MDKLELMTREIYDNAVWLAILIINSVMFFLSYLFFRLGRQARQPKWRTIFFGGSFVCFVIAIIRVIASVYFFEDLNIRMIFPITGALTWLTIGGVSYAGVRYIESTMQRLRLEKQSIALTDEVFDNVVKPLIEGTPVSRQTIESYKEKSLNLAIARN